MVTSCRWFDDRTALGTAPSVGVPRAPVGGRVIDVKWPAIAGSFRIYFDITN